MVEDILISFIIRFLKIFPARDKKVIAQNIEQLHNLCHLSPPNWNKLIHLASVQGVDMLLFYCLTRKEIGDCAIPEEQRQTLISRYSANLYRHKAFTNELKRILQIFNRKGVATLVLKGASLAENFYPLPELRPYSDIDLLVHKNDLKVVKEILIKSGYSPAEKANEEFNEKYWYSYQFFQNDKKVLLEIHWNIAQLQRYKINIESIWNGAISFKIDETESLMMSIEDLIIYQSLHLAYHYYSRLLWLIDIALIFLKKRDSVNWEKIIERCKTQRVCNPVYFTLLYLKNLLKVDIPKNVLKSLKPNFLTYIAIRSMFNTKTLPKRKIVENKLLRFPFALLLIDRMPEKAAFGMEFLHRIPSVNRLYRKE